MLFKPKHTSVAPPFYNSYATYTYLSVSLSRQPTTVCCRQTVKAVNTVLI